MEMSATLPCPLISILTILLPMLPSASVSGRDNVSILSHVGLVPLLKTCWTGMPTDLSIFSSYLHLSSPPVSQQVDLVHSGAMRRLTTASALRVAADDAGIPFDLVVFVPWWQKTKMVVLVPDVGAVPGALRKVVSIGLRGPTLRSTPSSGVLTKPRATLLPNLCLDFHV